MALQFLSEKATSSFFSIVFMTAFFCSEVPQPALARDNESKTNQTIKLRLKVSGPDNEWIRLEFNNDSETGQRVLTAYHTKRVKRSFESSLANGLLGFGAEELTSEVIDGYDGPVPLPSVNFHRWRDHKTLRLAFRPDACTENISVSDCGIEGTTSIVLPDETNIRMGKLTIEYAEEDLIRTITFRVPSEKGKK